MTMSRLAPSLLVAAVLASTVAPTTPLAAQPSGASTPTLYKRLGGYDALAAVSALKKDVVEKP